MTIIAVSYVASVLNFFIILLALVLALIVLIQRGKGGGLAGAFGGPGGSSAFGSRAGDAFTRITLIIAAIWVLLIMIQVRVVKYDNSVAQIDTNSRPALAMNPSIAIAGDDRDGANNNNGPARMVKAEAPCC